MSVGSVRVAACQAPLLPTGAPEGMGRMHERVRECEDQGVSILCCPEAILGGLADYAEDPLAIAVPSRRIAEVLAPLASETVTVIVGLTEITEGGVLYNAAAVLCRGALLGVYRKWHPAINRSVYAAGRETPVFDVRGLRFGILICNDSNFADPGERLVALGARAVFIPTNNGLPPSRGGLELVEKSRESDQARARAGRVWVVRADVAGEAEGRAAHGASGIVDPRGEVVAAATLGAEQLLIAEIEV